MCVHVVCLLHPAPQLGNFDDIDTDGDGVITLDELEGAMTKMLGRTPGAIEVRHICPTIVALHMLILVPRSTHCTCDLYISLDQICLFR